MIYKRLYNGNVVVRSLCGNSPHLLDPATAVTAVAKQLCQASLQPDRLWDIAHMLKQHTEAAVAAAAMTAAAASTSASALATAGEDDDAVAEAAEGRTQVAEPSAAAEPENGDDAEMTEPSKSPGNRTVCAKLTHLARVCQVQVLYTG